MKLEERKQNSFIQKSIFLLIIMTLWICLGTGFTVNAAQRESCEDKVFNSQYMTESL